MSEFCRVGLESDQPPARRGRAPAPTGTGIRPDGAVPGGPAIDTLLELSGTGAFGESSPVQQAWRDVHFAVAHISVNKSDIFGRYGRIALGVEETDTRGFF